MGQNIQTCVDCSKLPVILDGPGEEISTHEGQANLSQSIRVDFSQENKSKPSSQNPEITFLDILKGTKIGQIRQTTTTDTCQTEKKSFECKKSKYRSKANKENRSSIDQSRIDAIKRAKYTKDVTPILRSPGFIELNLTNVLDIEELRSELNSSITVQTSSNFQSNPQSPSFFGVLDLDSTNSYLKGISSNISKESVNLVERIRSKTISQ
ncbi:unnamed protein product [Blepharisma stoltei]|uniref:Uncharacterized protein n=1 Tax=Blepharisma stoltei TaxID=1481888 RepID=A0AAU9IE02_9CILI|nr:unnamed protein product [Blepharisma stoltei]